MKNVLFIMLAACIYHTTNTAAYAGIPAPMPPQQQQPVLTAEQRAQARRVADAQALELIDNHQRALGERERPGNRAIRRLFN